MGKKCDLVNNVMDVLNPYPVNIKIMVLKFWSA